jgi:hypothetical protein
MVLRTRGLTTFFKALWDTVGLFVMTVTVSTYTIFIKVRKLYRVLVMMVCFYYVTPFGIVTDEITLWGVRQTNLLLL